jgi:hypothetical protein
MQVMSTVNTGIAHSDFVNSRLAGVDTTGSQPPNLRNDAGSGSAQPQPVSTTKSISNWWTRLSKGAKIGIIAGAVLGGAIIIALISAIAKICGANRAVSRPGVSRVGGMGSVPSQPIYGNQRYQRLDEKDMGRMSMDGR